MKKLPADITAIFGSYSKGNETKASDIDIYIVTRSRNFKYRASKLNSKFSVKTGGYDKNSLLIKEIEKNHIIIKGVEKFYEKNQFFNQT